MEQSDSNQRPSPFFHSPHSNGILGNFYNSDNGVVESVLGKALDDSEGQLILSSFKEDADSPLLSGSITAGLENSGSLGSDPVNIPGGRLAERNNSGLNFSPSASSPLNHMGFLNTRFAQEPLDSISNQWQSLQSKMNRFGSGGMYDYNAMSPHHMVSPLASFLNNPTESSNQKLIKENKLSRQKLSYLDQIFPDRTPQRRAAELKLLSISQLNHLKSQLRGELEEIEQAILYKKGKMCMVCEENPRTETLPCNHFALCATCSGIQKECPYCQAPLTLNSNHVM